MHFLLASELVLIFILSKLLASGERVNLISLFGYNAIIHIHPVLGNNCTRIITVNYLFYLFQPIDTTYYYYYKYM